MIKREFFAKWWGLFFFLILGMVLFYFSNLFKSEYTKSIGIKGSIIFSQNWNNWGVRVDLLKRGNVLKTEYTSLNGSFLFTELSSAKYELLFTRNNIQIAKRIVYPGGSEPLKVIITEKHPGHYVDIVNMLVNSFLLGLIFHPTYMQ